MRHFGFSHLGLSLLNQGLGLHHGRLQSLYPRQILQIRDLRTLDVAKLPWDRILGHT